jgi:MSHA pilin protein MshD
MPGIAVSRFASLTKQVGFTLIELVAGIIAFAIVIALITGLIVPQATRSIDPIFQVRATELAQSLMNEISSKAFDEESDDASGGLVRCGESSQSITDSVFGEGAVLPTGISIGDAEPCTPPNELAADAGEVSRMDFDDVDDFNGLSGGFNGNNIENSLGLTLALNGQDLYEGFQVQVSVFYDSDLNGIVDDVDNPNRNTKLITITVITPNNEVLQFSSYRTNF